MTRSNRLHRLVALLLLPTLARCHAYRPPPPLEPDYWTAGRVYVGDRLRVHTLATGRVEGMLVRVDSTQIVLRVADTDRALAVVAVDSSWTWRATAETFTTVVGVVGGLLAAAAVIGSTGIGEMEGSQGAIAAIGLLAAGSVLGGELGSRAGRSLDSWVLVFPQR